LGVHENGGVDPHNILIQAGHGLPPVAADIVFQLHPVLPVVLNGAKPVVNLARRENETVLLAVRNKFFEKFFLCHGFVEIIRDGRAIPFCCLPQKPKGKNNRNNLQKKGLNDYSPIRMFWGGCNAM